jgi:FK506-binding protein 2
MRLSVLASIFLSVAAAFAADLGIETTHEVECERKTTKGDTVHMHYRGTLASDGSQFDASYDRGKPLTFKLGAGRVIKG